MNVKQVKQVKQMVINGNNNIDDLLKVLMAKSEKDFFGDLFLGIAKLYDTNGKINYTAIGAKYNLTYAQIDQAINKANGSNNPNKWGK